MLGRWVVLGRVAVPHVVTFRDSGDGGDACLPVSQRGGRHGGADMGSLNGPGPVVVLITVGVLFSPPTQAWGLVYQVGLSLPPFPFMLTPKTSTQALCNEGSLFVLMKRLRVQSLHIIHCCSFWLHYLTSWGLYLLICKMGIIVPTL